MVSEEKENHTSMLNLVMGNLERELLINSHLFHKWDEIGH